MKNIERISKRVGLFLSLLLVSSFSMMAQSIQVQGVVKDKSGEGIIGATVVVKGTANGTVTDINGNFILPSVQPDVLISVSFIGYITQEKNASSSMEFILAEDTKSLDEVVVVGYGTTSKTNISGAVSTVKTDELPKAAAASVGTMLRGRSSGMNITASSASPGASLNIAIRGGLSGQQPLIVIDGVPQLQTKTPSSGTAYSGADKDNALMNLNPDDIETINILKDASAASIYGSDASGGVILITTKRGKSAVPEISYSGSTAFQYIKDVPDFMNARDFMIEQNKVFDELGRGNEKKFTQEQIDSFVGNGTDWMKEVTRTGIVNEHNLSVNGGSEKTRYLFSTGLYDHKGVAKNNDMNRITGRINLDQDFGNNIKAGINTSFAQIKYHDVPLGDSRQDNSALIYSAMTFIPVVPVYDENGNYSDNYIRPNIYPNPVSLLEITDETISRDLFLSGYLEFKPIKDLTVRATGGTDMKDTQMDQYIPTTTPKGKNMNGQASKQNSKAQMNLINVVATYKKTFADKHDLSVMSGWEYKKTSWSGMGIVASNFPTDGSLMNNIGTSEQENPDISSSKGSNEMASYMGRINYSLLQRYILTLNLRVDGSSNFSQNHQWGYFPGASVAWRLNEESWLKNVGWLSNMKLRAGYGQTGNAGNLTGINTIFAVSRGTYAMDGGLVNGIGLSKIGNPNLKWEKLTDINVGLDFGFWRDRLSGTIDIYQRTREDVIVSKQLMSYQEINTIDYNSATQYQSQGIDLGIHSVNILSKDFEWSTDINLSYYRNRTTKRDPDFIPEPYQDYVEDWNNIYGYRTSGLVQDGESYTHLPSSTAGAILYDDLNSYKLDENGERMRDSEGRYIRVEGADGTLDAVDMVLLHNSTPIPFSVNNTFRWKNWDANIYLYGSLRGWKLNDVQYQSIYGVQDLTYGVNALSDVKNRWSYENPTGTLPGVAEANSGINPNSSDFFYEKAWYLRLDNVSLGYTFPNKLFGGYVKSARAYVAARNVYVFTPYNGMDPETGNGIGAYPNQSSIAFGLNFKF
ncbi:SusC/RagA family TonB-linked outer membrane protein [Mangrovibacterium lignilyticum]|uniref:SusC/RagA family TonB-linked outer membrane protein n=1 Tax=Mangrovibacterium lignilyticum TaxID=2668052 RepID=UPI001968562D|nr:TonB-dependent receptor [Mangrovibacterium lignilyticum]